jgi:hypothetical protein
VLQHTPLSTVQPTTLALYDLDHHTRMWTHHAISRARLPWLQVDTLKVGWCKIGEGDGAKALADLLMFNQTLSTVDLRGNILVRPPSPGTHPARRRCAVSAVTEVLHAGCLHTLRAGPNVLHLAPLCGTFCKQHAEPKVCCSVPAG